MVTNSELLTLIGFALNLLPAAEAGGPGPLKIVAAEMPGDVNNFADKI